MEKYIPVVVIKELGEIDKILTALKNNGINCAEITFRTACAKEAIEYAVKNYPDIKDPKGFSLKRYLVIRQEKLKNPYSEKNTARADLLKVK